MGPLYTHKFHPQINEAQCWGWGLKLLPRETDKAAGTGPRVSPQHSLGSATVKHAVLGCGAFQMPPLAYVCPLADHHPSNDISCLGTELLAKQGSKQRHTGSGWGGHRTHCPPVFSSSKSDAHNGLPLRPLTGHSFPVIKNLGNKSFSRFLNIL